MSKLSENFSREELACSGENCCGHSSPINQLLIDGLENLRKKAGARIGKPIPLKINSGFRCIRHNAKIGGAINSEHTNGNAADVATPAGLTDKEFFDLAMQVPEFSNSGIGLYDRRIHVGVENRGRRTWGSRGL